MLSQNGAYGFGEQLARVFVALLHLLNVIYEKLFKTIIQNIIVITFVKTVTFLFL